MFRFTVARVCALAAAIVVVLSACAANDGTPTVTSTPATTLAAPPEVASTSSSSTTIGPTTTTEAVRVIEVTFAGGQVVGGAQRTTVRLGERVRIRVTSDVADQIHVHTYDVKAAVAPDQPAQVDLVASVPGRHEVELEKKRRPLLVLEVR